MIAFFIVTSCKKMEDSYKQFVTPGGMVYPDKATSPFAYVGKNRIKISWLRGVDPTVDKARIFWDNYADSIEVSIPPTGDTISVIIDNLPEKSYTFYIKTYDSRQNVSVPVELLSAVYGRNYQSSLLDRPIVSAMSDADDLTIRWGGADITNGAFATEVEYTDLEGSLKTQVFSTGDVSSTIHARMPGSHFQYRTLFLPDLLSIDTFYTEYVAGSPVFLEKSDWSVIDFSNEDDASPVSWMIDGDPTSRWRTGKGHGERSDFFTVDMNFERIITSFELWRDQGNDKGVDTFQLLVSKDNVQWDDLGKFHFDRFSDEGQRYDIPSHPTARYWKFVGLPGPEDRLIMGEVSVYGY